MNKIFTKIHNAGIVEFIYIFITIYFRNIESFLKIFFLNKRGYLIDRSVLVGKSSYFFQSSKNSIKIGKNSRIGFGVRLEAGFRGKILIGENVLIHDYSIIYAHNDLKIGDNSMISPNVFITDFDHKFPHYKYKHLLTSEKGYDDKQVSVGSNVWIGTHSVILPGVIIGDNVVIGAGSVVTKSILSGSIVVGNPAKILKK